MSNIDNTQRIRVCIGSTFASSRQMILELEFHDQRIEEGGKTQ